MAQLKVMPPSNSDTKSEKLLADFARRVETFAPGSCPVAAVASFAKTAEVQTCGKCIPCRDGLPKISALLQEVLRYQATPQTLQELKTLAIHLHDSADCAIGWQAGADVIAALDTFAEEFESHVAKHECHPEIGQKVPCEAMCPAHVNIPGYIALAAEGDFAGAVNMIRKDNPFPTMCALVCEHPCEERCRRALIDAPVNIRGIKKYIVDNQRVDEVEAPKRHENTGKKIAVIGGGPSGLTCAYFSALMGHEVTVFEMHQSLGGMTRYGIPAYRFPRERLDQDIAGILSVGNIEVKLNTYVDAAAMKQIEQDFDAVYVAIGAHSGKSLRIDNADAKGVFSAVELLSAIGDGNYPDFTGKKVAIIGGGNVAMDCCRTAVRAHAAEVTCVYRRRIDDMTALDAEIESAIAEGVEMVVLEAPDSIEVNEAGEVCALITQPQYISTVRSGRPAPAKADKPKRRFECDIVLIAVGQSIDSAPFEEFGMEAQWGEFKADEYLHAQGYENVFVGGDCQTGPATVIRAIGAGKVAARNIDHYLGFNHTLESGAEAPLPKANSRSACGRVEVVERLARERKLDFEYVELPISNEEAAQECGRCLRCDHFGCGVLDGGRIQYV